MWIRTPIGNLCNLASATDVRIEKNPEDGEYDLVAYFVNDDPTTLAGFDKREDARETLALLWNSLKPGLGQVLDLYQPEKVVDVHDQNKEQ